MLEIRRVQRVLQTRVQSGQGVCLSALLPVGVWVKREWQEPGREVRAVRIARLFMYPTDCLLVTREGVACVMKKEEKKVQAQ